MLYDVYELTAYQASEADHGFDHEKLFTTSNKSLAEDLRDVLLKHNTNSYVTYDVHEREVNLNPSDEPDELPF